MTSIIRYSPRRRMGALAQDWNRLFDDFFSFDADTETSPTVWRPRVDLSETEGEYLLALDLPGIDKEDVHISFENDLLTVSGERHNESTDEGTSYYRTERMYGRFSRSFTFPKAIEVEGINAGFDRGVLTVHVPKAAESKPRRIEIQ